jgi:hypothetical protein
MSTDLALGDRVRWILGPLEGKITKLFPAVGKAEFVAADGCHYERKYSELALLYEGETQCQQGYYASDLAKKIFSSRDAGLGLLKLGANPTETRITDPDTGGQKGQKIERYDFLPFDALDAVARVYAFGAKKYDDHNWAKGYSWSLSLGALGRHFSAIMKGEDVDPESGELHAAHIAFHCFTLIAFKLRGKGKDDRCKI